MIKQFTYFSLSVATTILADHESGINFDLPIEVTDFVDETAEQLSYVMSDVEYAFQDLDIPGTQIYWNGDRQTYVLDMNDWGMYMELGEMYQEMSLPFMNFKGKQDYVYGIQENNYRSGYAFGNELTVKPLRMSNKMNGFMGSEQIVKQKRKGNKSKAVIQGYRDFAEMQTQGVFKYRKDNNSGRESGLRMKRQADLKQKDWRKEFAKDQEKFRKNNPEFKSTDIFETDTYWSIKNRHEMVNDRNGTLAKNNHVVIADIGGATRSRYNSYDYYGNQTYSYYKSNFGEQNIFRLEQDFDWPNRYIQVIPERFTQSISWNQATYYNNIQNTKNDGPKADSTSLRKYKSTPFEFNQAITTDLPFDRFFVPEFMEPQPINFNVNIDQEISMDDGYSVSNVQQEINLNLSLLNKDFFIQFVDDLFRAVSYPGSSWDNVLFGYPREDDQYMYNQTVADVNGTASKMTASTDFQYQKGFELDLNLDFGQNTTYTSESSYKNGTDYVSENYVSGPYADSFNFALGWNADSLLNWNLELQGKEVFRIAVLTPEYVVEVSLASLENDLPVVPFVRYHLMDGYKIQEFIAYLEQEFQISEQSQYKMEEMLRNMEWAGMMQSENEQLRDLIKLIFNLDTILNHFAENQAKMTRELSDFICNFGPDMLRDNFAIELTEYFWATIFNINYNDIEDQLPYYLEEANLSCRAGFDEQAEMFLSSARDFGYMFDSFRMRATETARAVVDGMQNYGDFTSAVNEFLNYVNREYPDYLRCSWNGYDQMNDCPYPEAPMWYQTMMEKLQNGTMYYNNY